MFIRGLPPINTHNHCVGTRNLCGGTFTSKNYWKTTFRTPRLSAPPSPHHHNTNNHYVGTRNHCVGSVTSKNYWKQR